MKDARIWAAGGYELAEGPRRVGEDVVFVDILSGRLLAVPAATPGEPRVLAQLDVPLGAVAPVAGAPGSWIAAAGTGIALVHADGRVEWLARPEDANPVATRMNDGCCDPAGRFWAGSMAYDNTPGAGSLYRVDPDGTVTRVLGGLTIANGPAFDPARDLMYVTDSAAGMIRRFRLDGTGDPQDGQVFATVDPADGSPDGMTVDSEGRLWTALWGGARVRCYLPDGTVDQEIVVPAPQPSSVCLGDRALFVTTARLGLVDAEEASGAVLRVDVGASAPHAQAWAGPEPAS
jgi:sugar lactone lactonase YvrE